jgi:hypothetical protein
LASLGVVAIAVIIVFATGNSASNAAMHNWYQSYGNTFVKGLNSDLDAANNDFDFENINVDCQMFAGTIQSAVTSPAPPEDSSQWRSALNRALQDAEACTTQGSVNGPNTLGTMTNDLKPVVRILASASKS